MGLKVGPFITVIATKSTRASMKRSIEGLSSPAQTALGT
jgi:hypothetical protein